MKSVSFLLFCVLDFLFSRDVVFVKLDSGIGNQMFQFAAAYNLARIIDADLKIVVSSNENANLRDPNDRKYRINKQDFHLDGIDVVSEEELNKEPFTFVWEGNSFHDLKGKGRILIASFFESEIFFKEHAKNIKKIFSLKKINTPFIRKFLPQIRACNSVAIHIRRGDFRNFQDRMIPLTYYMQAMQHFSKLNNVKFFVFSDDAAFARDCFSNLKNVVIVSPGDNSSTNLDEFYLMTQCKNLIVANSTFSWWAAYLCSNPSAKIIAPLPKYKDEYFLNHPEGIQRDLIKGLHDMESYPQGWITINPFMLH